MSAVDVESVLKDSSNDKLVVKWLESQLMTHDDRKILKMRGKEVEESSSSFRLADDIEKKNLIQSSLSISLINAEKDYVLTTPQLVSWDFNVFDIKSKTPQSYLAWQCFTSIIDLVYILKLPQLQLQNFLLFIEENYSMNNYNKAISYGEYYAIKSNKVIELSKMVSVKSLVNEEREKVKEVAISSSKRINQYHNNLHGADVLQAVMYICLKILGVVFLL